MRSRKRRVALWIVIAAALGLAAWAVWRLAPHAPIYLKNLELRVQVAPLDLSSLGRRLLIVAPHPDDEVLGPGGLIQQALEGEAEVWVALMTNGDGFQHERTRLWMEDVILGTGIEHQKLGRARQHETWQAMALCGVEKDHVIFLGYPDGGINVMWQPPNWSADQPWWSPRTRCDHSPYANSYVPGRPHAGAAVLSDMVRLIDEIRPTAVLTTPPFDVQRDHWATYDVVKAALMQTEDRGGQAVPLYTFLIHRHDWPAPQGYHPTHVLEPPAAWTKIVGVEWRRLDLTPDQVELKHRCLGAYRSQDAAHVGELLSFIRQNELFATIADAEATDGAVTIPDPIGDLPPDRVTPAEDIGAVELARDERGYRFSLRLAHAPEPKVWYAVVWHNVGAETVTAGSVVWHGNKAQLLESGPHGGLRTSAIPATVDPDGLSFHLSADRLPGPRLLLEAYSRRGKPYIDHTLTLAIRLVGPEGAPHAVERGALRATLGGGV